MTTYKKKDHLRTFYLKDEHCTIEYNDGSKHWWLNGRYHRLDGPAIEYIDGTKLWYLNGKPHRVDGPAIEHASGYKAWYLNGKEYSEKEHYIFTKRKGLALFI